MTLSCTTWRVRCWACSISLNAFWKNSGDSNECSLDVSYQRSRREPACVSSQGLAVFMRGQGSFPGRMWHWHLMGLDVTRNWVASVTIFLCVDTEPLTKPWVCLFVVRGFTLKPATHSVVCGQQHRHHGSNVIRGSPETLWIKICIFTRFFGESCVHSRLRSTDLGPAGSQLWIHIKPWML